MGMEAYYNNRNQFASILANWTGNAVNLPYMGPASEAPESGTEEFLPTQSILNKISTGELSPMDASALFAKGNYQLTPEQEKYMDNLIAQENATTAYERDKEFAQNSLMWDASQLGQLGLSNSGVLQTGGTAGSNEAARNSFENTAQAKYERNLSVAKSMISLVGSLAGAGIHGAAFMAAKNAAANASLAAARFVDYRRR